MPKMQKPENNQERQEEGQVRLSAALSLQGLQERVRRQQDSAQNLWTKSDQ